MTLNPPSTQRLSSSSKKHALPFADQEYSDRLEGLRDIMDLHDLDAVLLTSMHNVAYYSGFLYCSFGQPYACVVTKTDCVTVSAGIDGVQPSRRSFGDNITTTDWARDSLWQAVASVIGTGKAVGCEADHLTLEQAEKFNTFLRPRRGMDVAPATLQQRMIKSPAEIALIRQGANVAEIGAHAIREAITVNTTELELSIAGRNAMEREIARRFPDAEYRGTSALFQSGINTQGAHGPVTNRRLQKGDILRLNCSPMVSGYCTTLGRTLFLGDVDDASLRVWQTSTDTHEYGMTLLRPGASCADITLKINAFLAEQQVLQDRSFGSGRSLGILSDPCGSEAAPELREDLDTVLEPGMVISLQPMLTIPEGMAGAGGYREHDIFIVTEDTPDHITHYPCGPAFNVVG